MEQESKPLVNRLITIDEATPAKTASGKDKIRIIAGKLTYNIPFLLKNGGETKAYQEFKKLGLESIGKEIGIAFADETYERDGEQTPYRTIRVVDLQPDPEKYQDDIPSLSDLGTIVPNDVSSRLNIVENKVGKLEMLIKSLTEGQNGPPEAHVQPVSTIGNQEAPVYPTPPTPQLGDPGPIEEMPINTEDIPF